MRSSSPYDCNVQTTFQAEKNRFLKLLNYKLPQHPPDVFYIRRRPDLVKKYLNPIEYKNLVNSALPKHKKSYEYFKLKEADLNNSYESVSK